MDDIWDNWDINFDYESENMGEWNRHTEKEIYLTTFDGAQHLRLHGWLKRNDTLIKAENIADVDDYFGTFMVYMTDTTLEKLKDETKGYSHKRGYVYHYPILDTSKWQGKEDE